MPVVTWKSGALAPRKARRICKHTRGPWLALSGERDTSVDSSIFQTWAAIDKLAFDTGGRAFRGSNDIAGSVRQALDDARVVYVLGYQPDHGAWDGKFRPIEVRVKRTGARVRYRRGYFAVGDARAPGG